MSELTPEQVEAFNELLLTAKLTDEEAFRALKGIADDPKAVAELLAIVD